MEEIYYKIKDNEKTAREKDVYHEEHISSLLKKLREGDIVQKINFTRLLSREKYRREDVYEYKVVEEVNLRDLCKNKYKSYQILGRDMYLYIFPEDEENINDYENIYVKKLNSLKTDLNFNEDRNIKKFIFQDEFFTNNYYDLFIQCLNEDAWLVYSKRTPTFISKFQKIFPSQFSLIKEFHSSYSASKYFPGKYAVDHKNWKDFSN